MKNPIDILKENIQLIKSKIERQYQKELDKLSKQDEEKFFIKEEDPDDYRDNEEDR